MLRLDYLSCVLTIISTMMVGRRKWQGWLVAAVNSGVICVIGLRTQQTGFIPANVFCLALYACNVYQWRFKGKNAGTHTTKVALRAAPDLHLTQCAEIEPAATLVRKTREHRARRSAPAAPQPPMRRRRAARSH